MVNAATTAVVGRDGAPSSRALKLLARAREQLDDVAQLPDDWDSYGATRPTLQAIAVGHNVLAILWRRQAESIGDEAVPWMIAPLADGGVQIEWRGGSDAIEVEISPSGRLNFLVERDERTLRRSDPDEGALPAQVLDQIVDVIAGASAA